MSEFLCVLDVPSHICSKTIRSAGWIFYEISYNVAPLTSVYIAIGRFLDWLYIYAGAAAQFEFGNNGNERLLGAAGIYIH